MTLDVKRLYWESFGTDPLTGEPLYYGIGDRVNRETIVNGMADERYARLAAAAPSLAAAIIAAIESPGITEQMHEALRRAGVHP